MQNLPVRVAIDRAGLVGADGATHAGSYDIAYLSNLPGFVVMAAADELDLMNMVATAASYDDGPIAFRYPRGEGMGIELPEKGNVIEIGKGRMIREGKSGVAILNFGAHLGEVKEASEILLQSGIDITIADARFAKPLDKDLIINLAKTHSALISIEEGAIGGFGSHVSNLLSETGLLDGKLKFRTMFMYDKFIDQGKPENMYKEAGLGVQDIVDKVKNLMGVSVVKFKNDHVSA